MSAAALSKPLLGYLPTSDLVGSLRDPGKAGSLAERGEAVLADTLRFGGVSPPLTFVEAVTCSRSRPSLPRW